MKITILIVAISFIYCEGVFAINWTKKFSILEKTIVFDDKFNKEFGLQKEKKLKKIPYYYIQSLHDKNGTSFFKYSDSSQVKYFAVGKQLHDKYENYLILEKYNNLEFSRLTYILFVFDKEKKYFKKCVTLGSFSNFLRAGEIPNTSGVLFDDGNFITFNHEMCETNYDFDNSKIDPFSKEGQISSIEDALSIDIPQIEKNDFNFIEKIWSSNSTWNYYFGLQYLTSQSSNLPINFFYNNKEFNIELAQKYNISFDKYRGGVIDYKKLKNGKKKLLVRFDNIDNYCIVDPSNSIAIILLVDIDKDGTYISSEEISNLYKIDSFIVGHKSAKIKFDNHEKLYLQFENL